MNSLCTLILLPQKTSSRGCHPSFSNLPLFLSFLFLYLQVFFFFLATRGWIGNDMKTKLIDCNSIFQFLFISMFIVVHETSI